MPTPREKFREWLTENVAPALFSPHTAAATLDSIADKAAEFFAEPGQPSTPQPAAEGESLDEHNPDYHACLGFPVGEYLRDELDARG